MFTCIHILYSPLIANFLLRHYSFFRVLLGMSLLSIIDHVDTFPYTHDDHYYTFKSHTGKSLGFIVPEVAARFEAPQFLVDNKAKTVVISPELSDFEQRNKVFAELATKWRAYDALLDAGWRNELYTVYEPRTEPYFLAERAFACFLGVVTYGVHINGYIPADKSRSGKIEMWIPRRAADKSTYPGMLDNTIAGGLGYPYGIWENVVKECYEEGGLSAEFVETHIKSAGVISYLCQPYGPKGHAQPEVEYIYDLAFDSESENVPHPVDGEAQDFTLMDIDEIRLRMSEFKPNCALVIIDFLIRHGQVTPENEPNYLEIVSRLHRKMPFATRN